MGTLLKLDVNITLHLFDKLIKPMLLYGPDFWGCLKLPKNNPIENLQMAFCKELIGVKKQTSNLGVLIELGRIPLTIYAKKNCIKNWERIAIKKNSNLLVKTLYKWDLRKNIGWPKTIRDYLSGIGLIDIFLDERSRKPANTEAFVRENDIFRQTSFYEIQNNSSKLKTYCKFKKTIDIDMRNNHKIKDRISTTKLRLSNHKL